MEANVMQDLVWTGLAAVLVLLSLGYAKLCERL
jgi:hypothetical protein